MRGLITIDIMFQLAFVMAVCFSNHGIVNEKGLTMNSAIFSNSLDVTPNVVQSCNEGCIPRLTAFNYVVLTYELSRATYPRFKPGYHIRKQRHRRRKQLYRCLCIRSAVS